MQKNNHGCYAKVGDLVEVLNSMGQSTGFTGLVCEILEMKPFGDFDDPPNFHKRFVVVTGIEHRVKDSFVRVLSTAH